MASPFFYSNKILQCESLDLLKLTQKKQTPFYLYSKQEITNNCTQVISAGSAHNFLPCYALKANYNMHLLKLIHELGFGADVVSGGELYFALRAGFAPEKIVFAGVGKTAEEIEFAIKTGIHSLNIESEQELLLTAEIASKLEINTRIAFRLNPDIEAQTHDYISTGLHKNKFGISSDEALRLYKIALKNDFLKTEGLHVHIGSQITTSVPYIKTIKFLHSFIDKLNSIGVHLSFIDLGGGIGINYNNNFSERKNNSTFINEILPPYLDGFKDLGLEIVIELGRSIIGSAGILISKIIYSKQTPQKKFLIVDAAMNNLIRPSLYDAYHEIVPLHLTDQKSEVFDVVGPVCESGDFFAKDRKMPHMQAGEYIVIVGAGAYGQVLSSNYNLRPRIAEYLVDGTQIKTIYPGEKIEDMANQYV